MESGGDGFSRQERRATQEVAKALGSKDRRKVEARIWIQILSLESTIFSELNGALATKYGLSVAKFEFLAQVDRYPDGVSLGTISSNLRVTSGNVSGLVRRLLAEGLITKKMSQKDRRSFIVRFTPKGKQLFDKANVLHAATLAKCLEKIPLGELEGSLRTLKSLVQEIRGYRDGQASART
jgi:DNA-binding MarR family transcriptional regulator